MNFREYMDSQVEAEAAWRQASQMIRRAAGGAYAGLADFYVMTYTDEELADLGEPVRGGWVGQYVRGSIDSARGPTVLLHADYHQSRHKMVDTLLHEMGHALWDLLDEPSRQTWNQNQAKYKWGPEEAFADDFMHLCKGELEWMNNEQLFFQITRPGNE